MKPWIGVDLDGTLAEYHGYVGPETIGPPIPLMLERVRRWVREGKDVRIFTARVDGAKAVEPQDYTPETEAFKQVPIVRRHIEEWCLEHIGCVLPVTNIKDYAMVELWDDRAVQVEKNTGRRVDGEEA